MTSEEAASPPPRDCPPRGKDNTWLTREGPQREVLL